MSAKIHHFQENRENNRGIHRKSHRGNGRPARYRQGNTGGTPVLPALNTGGTPMPPAQAAFSLIEILVAMAVLAMLMTFMFSMVGGTSRLWERGNAKIEAAQAARVGLNRMAEDLQNAFSTTAQSVDPSKTSIAPLNSANTWGQPSSVTADGSSQIAGFRVTGDPINAFREFGYLCVYITDTNGWGSMRGNRYFLVQHRVNASSINFPNLSASWVPTNTNTSNRSPIIDNCVRFELEYYNAHGSTPWSKGSQTNLPDGVLATVIVIDSRTAERIAIIKPQLSSSDIDSITNAPSNPSDAQRLLRSGSVVMRRFIPFNNHQH